jgi:putative peptidoglycan lipid II flippase
MAVTTVGAGKERKPAPLMLGGFSALAESAWMGVAQAAEVLEVLNIFRGRQRGFSLHLPRLQLHGILTRELTIAEASFVLMASFFFSALLGAVRQVLFNAQFGAGSEATAYYAAFRLPDTLFSLIAGGALSSAMIPVLLSTSRDDSEDAGRRLTSLVLNTLLAAFAIIVVAGELLTPAFVTKVLAPGFDTATGNLTVGLTRLMLIQPLILAVGSVATAVLNSRNRFLLTAASVASHNIGLILGIMASRLYPSLGVYGPAGGVVLGAGLQVLILLPGLAAGGFRYRALWNLGDRRLREVIALLVPNGLAVAVGSAGFIIDTSFASRASQAAALPALQNAFLLVALPIALLGQAVGQSAFPRLAAYASSGEWKRMRRTLLVALGAVVALAVPATLVLVVLGRPVVRILFEHGKFGSAAGLLTYQVLGAYALALPAYVGAEVVIRGLIAMRDTRTPLISNSLQLAGRALIMTALIGSIGVFAIPAAFAVMATLETLALAGVFLIKIRRRAGAVPALTTTT